MPIRNAISYDVIIAGAGAVGLFLACELRLAALSVLVLEQAADPHATLKRAPFGTRGLSSPTLEALDRRGFLDEVLAALRHDRRRHPASAHWMQQSRRPAGHFAGIQFYQDQIDGVQWPYRFPNPAGLSLPVDLESLESVLAARALAMGVEIRRGARVDGLKAADDSVAVFAASETFHGRWLVGCDGGRSTVRKAAGFTFAGTDPEFTGYSVDVELATPHPLRVGRHHTATGVYTYAEPGTITMADFDNGACHRRESITPEHVQAVLRRVSGLNVTVTVTALRLAATWTDRARQATRYRDGRILLAGDAAHIHSPLGGQGLNLGIGDAMNLGWKLAATIRGHAPAGLLDSYSAERHPVGAQVLDWSRAQVALMRPTPGTRALASVVRDLMETRDGARYFAERVWGMSLRYDLGDEQPLVGRSVPDFTFSDGTRVGEHLRSGCGLLLDFDGRSSMRALARRWQAQISYVAQVPDECLGLAAVLVRPDGVIAWIGSGEPDLDELAARLTHWFGEPES
ncbi:FAD-dependent monooxygenase [Solimonas marina]|uniref:FAD-dependent oxidoreductase n=1 Tax=Solimonas marina TaxID=2714601 RepID=A0A969WHI5_9GAMM|nr:FAD-dependent monooxygenase [Solimonas marina]NKF24780.1 FAD-dependent oxidoreductase [Solimonas marina]